MSTPAQILVIEDDRSVSDLLVTMLEGEGHEARVAGDGLEGLLKVQLGQVDLALLDIMMPDVDGERVLRQLLEEGDGTLPVPIVVMTGSPDGAATARTLLGRENVFEKPFDPDALLARVRDLLTK